jgi:hypothetical protein
VTGLVPDKLYSFYIEAKNLIGKSEASNIIDIKTLPLPEGVEPQASTPPIDLQNVPSITNAH